MSFIQYMVPCDIEEGTYGQPEANATAMKSLPSSHETSGLEVKTMLKQCYAVRRWALPNVVLLVMVESIRWQVTITDAKIQLFVECVSEPSNCQGESIRDEYQTSPRFLSQASHIGEDTVYQPTAQDTHILAANSSLFQAFSDRLPFFEIRPSKLGGLGAFAVRHIESGDIIHSERPLLKTTVARLLADFEKLPAKKKNQFLHLSRSPVCPDAPVLDKIRRANAFEVPGGGIAIFWKASRFNHACQGVRNVRYKLSAAGWISLRAIKPVAPGEELLVAYGTCPYELYRTFGFRCSCGECEPLSEATIYAIDERNRLFW